jgi:hypothetical protein
MPSMVKVDRPNYIVRQLDERTRLVEHMREKCAEVPERGLYWMRRGLTPAHSDVTRAFENPFESFVLEPAVPLELKGIICESFHMAGWLY